MKTIRMLSASIGISKVSIYKAIKREEMKPYIFKDKDGMTMIDEIGESLLINLFNCEKAETVRDISSSILTDSKEDNKLVNSSENLIVSLLQNELKQKNDEINSLLKIITSQQSIQGRQQFIDNKSFVNTDSMVTYSKSEQKKGFFSWFKK